MKIGYITNSNARDKTSWSGLHNYISKSLEKHCGDVIYLSPIKTFLKKPLNALSKGVKILTNNSHTFAGQHTLLLSKEYSLYIQRFIKNHNIDVIFAAAASTELASLKTNIPIVYLSDATFKLVQDFYPELTNLFEFSKRQGNKIEELALHKSSLAVFSSDWAAQSAINDYKVNPEKILVLPFGANIDSVPTIDEIVTNKISGNKNNLCKLLFIGVNWERKGGDIALKVFELMKSKDINCHLTICGCVPPLKQPMEDITVIPFLDKNDSKDAELMNSLFLNSHFLILPTRQDCTPIVFSEASAFGLPSITSDTGGIKSVIQNDINGVSLPIDSAPEEYADLIIRIFSNEHLYSKLILSTRERYDSYLNWDYWGNSMRNTLAKVIEHK